ncbi:MAG: alpha-amylase family glycosyl hydrolase [Pseudonocardia sp.]
MSGAPSSAYRLQFSEHFSFSDATKLVPYLDGLGVDALYASPLLESEAGSNHGYDIVDPTRVSDERGGEHDRRALFELLGSRNLGLVLDIVPNHLGVQAARANPWWWDALAHGCESRYADYFDIDWDAGPVLLPILDADEDNAPSELVLSEDRRELRHYEHSFRIGEGTADATDATDGPPAHVPVTARQVHERQHHRLVSWRHGASELTCRQFFDVSALAAVRAEDPQVFQATHAEVLRWVVEGGVDGLRVDHPDGPSDPDGYVRRLRAALGEHRWATSRALLDRLDQGWLPDVDADGAVKLLLTRTVLWMRREDPRLFTGYRALHAKDPAAEHAIAFARSAQLVAVATRLSVGLAKRGGWSDTVLPLPGGATSWYEALTGTAVDTVAPRQERLMGRYPVAMLVRSS